MAAAFSPRPGPLRAGEGHGVRQGARRSSRPRSAPTRRSRTRWRRAHIEIELARLMNQKAAALFDAGDEMAAGRGRQHGQVRRRRGGLRRGRPGGADPRRQRGQPGVRHGRAAGRHPGRPDRAGQPRDDPQLRRDALAGAAQVVLAARRPGVRRPPRCDRVGGRRTPDRAGAAGRLGRVGKVADTLDHGQRRFPPVAVPIAVVYKFFDDQGNYLAAIITYYAFVGDLPAAAARDVDLRVRAAGQPRPAAAGAQLDAQPVPDHRRAARPPGGAAGLDVRDRGRRARRALRLPRARAGAPERDEHRVVGAAQQPPEPDPAAAAQPLPADDGRAGGGRDLGRLGAGLSNTQVLANAGGWLGWLVRLGTVLVVGSVLTLLFRLGDRARPPALRGGARRVHRGRDVAGAAVPRHAVRHRMFWSRPAR